MKYVDYGTGSEDRDRKAVDIYGGYRALSKEARMLVCRPFQGPIPFLWVIIMTILKTHFLHNPHCCNAPFVSEYFVYR